MKKQISYLIAALYLLTFNNVKADPLLPANIQGYSPGAYNATETQNINNYQIDRSYIQSFDTVTKDEQIYDASIEEHEEREGMIYNPHFLLEKINFEGNTVIPTKELEKLGLEVIGEDIFFDELLEVCQKVTNYYRSKGYLTSYATVPPQRTVEAVAKGRIL